MKQLDFEPIGKLTTKKSYHYICISLAVIVPVAVIIVTLVKGTFSPMILVVCVAAVVVALGIDYSNRSNVVAYNDEKIALFDMLGKPKIYLWDDLNAVFSGKDSMRLEFKTGKKLYINLEYDGVDDFIAYLGKICEKNGI